MYENQYSNLSNFLDIQLENDISIITLDDNINHTYCSKIQWEFDNYTPLGLGRLIMPYSKDIEKYWIKYSGAVVIHANLNPHKNNVIASKINSSTGISLNLRKVMGVDFELDKKYKNKIRFKNDNYNYAFIGKISRFKQIGKTFIVYLEDLGWKFMQKVPKTFRETYIANQTLDDAFQAICEFIGVDFAYSIEDLAKYNFAADGYSIEKDGTVIENVPTILKEWSNKKEEENNESELTDEQMADALKDGQPFEASGLMEYKKKKIESTNNSVNKSLNSLATNSNNKSTNEEDEEDEEDTEKENQNVDEKIKKYQQEFDDKIKDLFIGNTYYESNIADPVMNYDWITITPKVPSSDIAVTGGDSNAVENEEEIDNSSSSNFNWKRMSQIINKYFNKNHPNQNTIISAFRNCSDDWRCLSKTYDKYKKYCSAKNKNQVIRELKACFT